jgi:hypothetical protein
MKIPFGLHRRIPQARRVLELLAQTTSERDAARREIQSLNATLTQTLQRNGILERALVERVSQQHPLLYGNTDAQMGERAKRIWSLLRPMDAVGKRLIRKGRPHDGGYAMIDHGLQGAIAYSLGINDDVSWDLDMAAMGCQIYQYDHTIDRLPVDHPNFHWFKKGIAASPSADGMLDRLDDLIAHNGHAGRSDLILKMDIEGFEWEVFEAMAPQMLAQFSQITLEAHSLALADAPLHKKIVGALSKLYAVHQPVHVHANNHGYVGVIGGVMIPDTMEVTYVRRADHCFMPCARMFPSEIDMACRPDVPDFFLGALGALPEPELEESRASA